MGLPMRLNLVSYVVEAHKIDIRAIYLGVPATDHVDQIAIATLYLLVMMVMAVLIRLAFRLFMLRSLQWDDATVALSLVFGIAQSSTILAGTRHGLGKRQLTLGDVETIQVEEYLYVSDLLYIVCLSLAKISVLQFLDKLNVNKLHKKTCFLATLVIIAWAIAAFFTLAFQCGASNPWDRSNGNCINIFDFWAAMSPVDILTELIICILPIYIIKPVQVSFRKKFTVVAAFSFRIFVIIATVIRLAFLRKSPSSADMTTYAFQTTVMTQCVLCVSLMTACIPCLKPFLDAFETGMLNVSLHRRIGGGSNSNSYGNSYALAGMSRGGKRESAMASQYVEDEIEMLGSSAAAFAVTPREESSVGRSSPSTMVIQRTDQWSVRCEYMDTKPSEDTGSETSANRVVHAM